MTRSRSRSTTPSAASSATDRSARRRAQVARWGPLASAFAVLLFGVVAIPARQSIPDPIVDLGAEAATLASCRAIYKGWEPAEVANIGDQRCATALIQAALTPSLGPIVTPAPDGGEGTTTVPPGVPCDSDGGPPGCGQTTVVQD